MTFSFYREPANVPTSTPFVFGATAASAASSTPMLFGAKPAASASSSTSSLFGAKLTADESTSTASIFGSILTDSAATADNSERDSSKSERLPRPSLASTKKRPTFDNPTEFVTLIAGKEETETKFVVHKDFIYHYCPTLKAAFESPCVEGQTKIYRLEDAEAHTVKLLVHWIYCQDLVVEIPKDTPSSKQYWLIRLWVLADKLLMRGLQNAAMQGIEAAREEQHMVATNSMHFIYENTASKSPLRLYYVHVCMWYMSDSVFSNQFERFPKEMLFEMAMAFRKQSSCATRKLVEFDTNRAQYGVAEEN